MELQRVVAAFAAEAPAPYGPVPSARQLQWHTLEFYGFLHFTVNTFTDKEWGYGDESPDVFAPTDFDPEQIVGLAAEVGVSRAALSRRFHDLVGEPPMTFLTNWRIDLAADLLRQPDPTLGAVAQQVGYSTPFALSSAFKRVRGVRPQAHRETVTS